MTRKQWAALCMTLLTLCLGGVIALVMLIDPFQIYHRATAFIPPIENGHQIYANAGIAKSYDYDSVIIGSSMTENFTPSHLDSLFGGRFVKLCINAGTPFNHKQMMDMAFDKRDLKTVFYGLDIEMMTYFYTTPKCEMPEYLYDRNPFNDVYYWFNKSVLTKYIPQCLKTLGQSDPHQRDTMYSWGDLYPYGKDVVIGDLQFSTKKVKQDPLQEDPELAQAYRLNLEHNLLPFITAHPDTQFILFFSPYSAMRWYQFCNEGLMQYYFNQKAAVVKALLPYENVRIYDFQAMTHWITDLDLYIDTSHYSPHINDAMAEMMSRDECRVRSVSDVLENNAAITDVVRQIRKAGCWPEHFPLAGDTPANPD